MPGGRRRPSRAPTVLLTVFGLLVFLGGAGVLALELFRPPTPAETAAAVQQEIATRWERMPAGKVFPATISYKDGAGNSSVVTRVGIAPPVSCQAALEPSSYQRVQKFGCRTMLRATYVDASGTLAVTVGVGVMRSAAAAQNAWVAVGTPQRAEGLRAVSFAGTITGQFGDNARAVDSTGAAGPYLFAYTAGHTDGQPGSTATSDQAQLTTLGDALELDIEGVLTDHGSPCHMKDIRC
ncbi:MAG: hypothetical protein J2P27_07025 [Actinobacteria bacterium]|nr:hypothetical protein [Actinomycetota bacterium]